MSDQELSVTDEDQELEELFKKAEEEETPPQTEDPEPVGETTEESPEEAPAEEETPEQDQPEGEPELSDLLQSIPEDLHPTVEQVVNRRLGAIQSGWQEKLDQAAEHRKMIEDFEARVANDPQGLIRDLEEHARKQGYLSDQPAQPAGPEDPGPMPDPMEDPDGWKAWFAKDRVYQQHQVEQKLAEKEREISERLKPIQTRDQVARQREFKATAMQTFGLDEAGFEKLQLEMKKVQTDPQYALKTLAERVKMNVSGKQKAEAERKAAKEAAQAAEERPGLPRTGVRQAPRPTGDPNKDLLAEVEATGLEVPEEFKD